MTNSNIIKKTLILIIFTLISPIIKSNSITIVSPDTLITSLNNKNKLDLEFSSFGKIPFNFYARGEIILSNENNDYACEKLNNIISTNESNDNKIKTNFIILLLKRGICTFVTKVRNAQKIGANMVIIINDNDEEIHNLIIADDGTGNDIYIPSAIISKKDGDKIYNFLKKNDNKVYVIIDFLLNQNKQIELETFFSSSEIKAYQLLIGLSEYFSEFNNQIIYKPRYVTHKSPNYDKNNRNKISNCVSGGLYCYFPKKSTIVQDGELIILENLIQKCVYKESFIRKDIYIYFKYMEYFYNNCININKPDFSEKCSNNTLKYIGLNESNIYKCIANSFGVSKYSNSILQNDNNILKNDYDIQSHYYINSFPAVIINKSPIEGIIKLDTIIENICYYAYERPYFCNNLYHNSIHKKFDFTFWVIIIGLFILLFIIIISLIFWCRKYIQMKVYHRIQFQDIDINGRINNVINNYFAIKERSKV